MSSLLALPFVAMLVFVLVLAIPLILLNINAYMRRLWKEQLRTNELLEGLRRPRESLPSVKGESRR